jgi:hypothetical protein
MAVLYIVVSNTDLTQFSSQVSNFLSDGWQCQGGVNVMERLDTTNAKYNMPCYMITTYSQALVYDEGEINA